MTRRRRPGCFTVTTAADNLGLDPQVTRLLGERAAADGRAAEAEREYDRLRRDILHLRRTLGHETARCDAMQAEMMKRNAKE